MTIETICQGCSRKLRVADEHAGKQARCPQCGTIYTVPGTAGQSAARAASPVSNFWFMKTPDGREYGPVRRTELDKWAVEGRIPPHAELRADGTDLWQAATQVYPRLSPVSAPKPAEIGNPFADRASDNPYTPGSAVGMSGAARQQYARPHRGGLILALGILGWAVCAVFAPFAWGMGSGDLKAMRSGEMNPEGMGLTQAGMILGMIQTILLLLFLGIAFLVIIAQAAA
jgi:hypothetical protein